MLICQDLTGDVNSAGYLPEYWLSVWVSPHIMGLHANQASSHLLLQEIVQTMEGMVSDDVVDSLMCE